MQEWNSSVHARSGVPCHPTVVNIPSGADGQPVCDLRKDEIAATQKHWIQELECQREENQQQRQLDNQRMYRSDIFGRADAKSPRPEKGTELEEDDSSESDTWSSARGQGCRSGTDTVTSDERERQLRDQDYKRAIEAQIDEKQQRLRAEREAEIRQDRKQEQYMEEDRCKLEQECQREQLEQSGQRHNVSSESQGWNPSGHQGGGAPCSQPVASSPVRTDAQAPCDLREDEKEETQRHWMQELDCQREENKQQGHEDKQRMLRSDGFSWANDETPRTGRVAKPEKDFSDSAWSFAQGQGYQSGTDTKLLDDQERRQRSLDYQRAIQAQMHEKEQRQRADREAVIREDREQQHSLEEDWRKGEHQYQEEQLRERYKQGN